CGALLYSPILHGLSHHIRHCGRELLAFFNGFLQLLVNLFRKAFLHHLIIKHIFTENLGYIHFFTHKNSSSFLLKSRNRPLPASSERFRPFCRPQLLITPLSYPAPAAAFPSDRAASPLLLSSWFLHRTDAPGGKYQNFP